MKFLATILDRDGTIIRHVPYLADPIQVELLDNACLGISALRKLTPIVVVCSNQSAIGRGYCSRDDVLSVNFRMNELLEKNSSYVDEIIFCPHAPEENCECRKPRPGMGVQVAKHFGIPTEQMIVIGDMESDVEFARSLGALSVIIRNDPGTMESSESKADIVATDLLDAAIKIEHL